MKLHNNLRSVVALTVIYALSTFTPTHARKSADDNTNNDHSPSSTVSGSDLISTPTYSQTMEDAMKGMMEDFSSHMTSLHESFVQHPLFHVSRFGQDPKPSSSSKPFSTWGSFGSLKRWSPRYEVIDDAKNLRVKMDVPGFHFHEMKVELESGGRVLSISGTKENNFHEASDQPNTEKKAAMGEKANEEKDMDDEKKFEFTSHTSTSFQQKFTLDPSIDTSLMTANLVDGVLEVRAPRKHGAWNKKYVPITQFDEDVWEELAASEDAGETEGTSVM
eukprot:27631_1